MKYNKNKIALIGVGLLGASIAQRLLKKGFEVGVWNRTKKKCDLLVSIGAKMIFSFNDISNDYDTIIMVLKDGEISISLIQKLESIKGKLLIQMGTIGSRSSKILEEIVIEKGGYFLEAPVLGSVNEALAGKLLCMIGGSEDKFLENENIFSSLSHKYIFFGSSSKASNTKLLLNFFIGILTYSYSISLRFIEQKNIELDSFMDLLRVSALYAPTFDKKLTRMINCDFKNGNFNLSNLSKDISLFTEESKSLNIDTQLLDLLNHILKKHTSREISDLDYSALHELTSKEK